MELKLIKIACDHVWGVSIETETQKRPYFYGRSCYYKIAKKNTRFSLASIGELVKKDHSCVLHGLAKFDEYSGVKGFNEKYEMCEEIYQTLKQHAVKSIDVSEKTINDENVKDLFDIKINNYELKIEKMKIMNEDLMSVIAELKSNEKLMIPDFVKDIIKLPEDLKQEFIDYRWKPFKKMIDSRESA